MPRRKKHSAEILARTRTVSLRDIQGLREFGHLIQDEFKIEPWLRGEPDTKQVRDLIRDLRKLRSRLSQNRSSQLYVSRHDVVRCRNYPTLFASIYLKQLRRKA